MKQNKKFTLNLNKQIIEQLDRNESAKVVGGLLLTSVVGSNCNNSDPNAHKCCVPKTDTQTVSGACNSQGTVNTQMCNPQ